MRNDAQPPPRTHRDEEVRIELEWREADAPTNYEVDRKCLKGYSPTLIVRDWIHRDPLHLATITPLSHGDPRYPRRRFFGEFYWPDGRSGGTRLFSTVGAAKRWAEKIHGDMMASESVVALLEGDL